MQTATTSHPQRHVPVEPGTVRASSPRVPALAVLRAVLNETRKSLLLLWGHRTVVLLGHEWHGIPEEQVEAADLCVEIPMVGRGASLNVAVAGSLVLYRLAGMA